MTEQIFFLFFSVVLCAYGEGIPQESVPAQKVSVAYGQPEVCDDCETNAEQPNATGTHGHEIILPIGEREYLPSAWYWVNMDYGPSVRRHDNARIGSMDWGYGNALYSVLSYSRPPLISIFVATGKDYQVVGHISGMFAHVQPGLVRGSVELMIEQDSQPVPIEYQAVELVLQVHGDQGWIDVATKIMHTGRRLQLGELESTVDPSTQVRLEVRAWRDPSWGRLVHITKMRLFGAECYVDQSDPTQCI